MVLFLLSIQPQHPVGKHQCVSHTKGCVKFLVSFPKSAFNPWNTILFFHLLFFNTLVKALYFQSILLTLLPKAFWIVKTKIIKALYIVPERASWACLSSISKFLICCWVALTSSVASWLWTPPLLGFNPVMSDPGASPLLLSATGRVFPDSSSPVATSLLFTLIGADMLRCDDLCKYSRLW